MSRWKYDYVAVEENERVGVLNEWGKAGWRCVNPSAESSRRARAFGQISSKIVLYFEREEEA